MIKRSLFLLIILFCAITTTAQRYVVQGYITDGDNGGEPLPLAMARLIEGDSATVANAFSDDGGFFSLQAKKAGEYTLQLTFIGYDTIVKSVELTSRKQVAKMGRIKMYPNKKLLREVEVSALAQQLTIKADTFLFNTNAFRLPPGASIAVLMKQMPGLSMDENGNLTFQGKAVSEILVNGKPFFGDANAVMSNMTSDAVENVQIYEKTDEEKEFMRQHDTDKGTVIDLKIKKEYMSSWNVNADLAGGSYERYLAKVFASNFTDKRRTAVFAQVNNISQNQRVDENGNWQYWGGMNGLFTYRKTGAIMSWENGKKNTEGGFLRTNVEVTLNHDNNDSRSINNSTSILGSDISHYTYSESSSDNRNRGVDARGNILWNIDTLNRLDMSFSYRYSDASAMSGGNTSVYDCEQLMNAPSWGLIGDSIAHDIRETGVYSTLSNSNSKRRNMDGRLNADYTRRFGNSGAALNIDASFSISSSRSHGNMLSNYRYFNEDAPEPEKVNRRYTLTPNDNESARISAHFNDKIGERFYYSFGYSYYHGSNSGNHNLYMLDRYSHLATMRLPLGVRPSTPDSLLAVMSIENSYFSSQYDNRHSLNATFSSVWEKIEANIDLNASMNNEHLYYKRNNVYSSPSRSYTELSLHGGVRLKPVESGEINVQYSGSPSRPSLSESISYTDTSDEMVEVRNNTESRTLWENNIFMYGNFFNSERGDNYSFFGGVYFMNENRVSTMQTDPVTGKQIVSTAYVDGVYNAYISLNTEQPLDTARHWTLRGGVSYNISSNKSYTGVAGNELGLSQVYTHSPHAGMRLNWRSGMWSMSLHGSYTGSITRYDNSPSFNQEGHTYECLFEPQVELPFGMKIYTSMGYYARSGFEDDLMNHDQWLWNATVSQTLLKNRALTLQLEAVDILKERTAEYFHTSANMRLYSRTETFLSYVMLHAIYRFNIGGKSDKM